VQFQYDVTENTKIFYFDAVDKKMQTFFPSEEMVKGFSETGDKDDFIIQHCFRL
jgi:hypothetical protein